MSPRKVKRIVEINSSIPWDVDDSIEAAFERQGPDRPLKIRIAPTIWVDAERADGAVTPFAKGNYQAWKKVSWNVQIWSLAEAQQLRTGLQLFFRAAASFGIAGVVERLQVMLREAPPAPEIADSDDEAIDE